VRWSAFGNASGVGNSVSPVSVPVEQSLRPDRPDILMHWPALAYIRTVPQGRGTRVLRWADDNLLHLKREEISEHYGRYRLHLPEAERAMARSLQRYGQLSPIVVCRRQERYELIDGFKRLSAARGLAQIQHLSARLMEADERTAKAAIYGLNRAGGRTRELEEAWIIQALVREDGLSQVEVAELLGRHKSWVCRRLALIERLGPKARDELRVGLLSPTSARQIVRLPEGNQAEVLAAIRREALSSAELSGVVDLWLRCAERRQQEYLLAHPREALSQAKGALPAAHDPRLSEAGNQVWKRVGLLLDVLGRMEVWLAHQGRTGLTPEDRVILSPRFQKLSRDARSVAALSQDFVSELEHK
jgi:ParB-like chromosome segregation protein Spo0J